MGEYKNQKEKISNPELLFELQEMAEVDQAMRSRHEADKSFWDKQVDINNTERMKEIVVEYGFPTISMVGLQGFNSAWLLVQHADHDPEFQYHCLDLLHNLPSSEIDAKKVAYLTDRVRVNNGQPQLYGTQFNQINGEYVPREIEDIANIDQRRAEIGMGPFSEQIESMYKKYDIPIKAYVDLRGRDLSKEDLSKIPTGTLLKCDFDDETKWPEIDKLPAGFNPAEVLKSCQNPGLGIRQIHEEGINGRGVVVAIIDQSLSDKRGEFTPHSEYADRIVDYKEFGVGEDEGISMHGPAVISLLVGKNCGIAPKAEVVYRAVKSGERDFNHFADALLDLVKFNRDAPPNRKIRIVSCSIGYQEQKPEPGLDRWIAAIKLAEEEGIVVSDVGERTGVDYIGGGASADKENPDNYELALFLKEKNEKIFTDPEMIKLIRNKDVEGVIKRLRILQPKETADISDEELRLKVEKFLNSPDSDFGMIIPSDYRTMASYKGADQYVYNGKGGMSWAVPYLSGIFALAWQLKPNITKNQIADIINRTATVNSSGLRVINPTEIIEEVINI